MTKYVLFQDYKTRDSTVSLPDTDRRQDIPAPKPRNFYQKITAFFKPKARIQSPQYNGLLVRLDEDNQS